MALGVRVVLLWSVFFVAWGGSLPSADAGAPFDVVRVWTASVPGLQGGYLGLVAAESYEDYYFMAQNAAGAGPAASYVVVREIGTESTLCEGAAVDLVETQVYRSCHDLEAGRHYEVRWTAAAPGERLVLYGFDRVTP